MRSDEKRNSLFAGEEQFRVLAETASDAIISIDKHSTMLFVNPAAERIFGYSREELLGQNLTMLMPAYLRLLHDQALRRYTDTGIKHITWSGIELPGLHKSGTEITLEVSFGEFSQNGQPIFTGIIRDVSERRRLEQAHTPSGPARPKQLDAGKRQGLAVTVWFDSNDHGGSHLILPVKASKRFGFTYELVRG